MLNTNTDYKVIFATVGEQIAEAILLDMLRPMFVKDKHHYVAYSSLGILVKEKDGNADDFTTWTKIEEFVAVSEEHKEAYETWQVLNEVSDIDCTMAIYSAAAKPVLESIVGRCTVTPKDKMEKSESEDANFKTRSFTVFNVTFTIRTPKKKEKVKEGDKEEKAEEGKVDE